MKHPVYQGRRLSSLTIALIIISCVAVGVVAPNAVKKTVSLCVYPLFCLQRTMLDYVSGVGARRATLHELETTVQALRHDNDLLMARLIENASIDHYMNGIEELLAFKRRYELHRAHCVQILSRTVSEQSHTLLIDAGSLRGIQVDMIALYNNVLLGRVVEVYPDYSKVVLVSDRGCKVAAYCSATGASGIHEGCNGTTTLLSKVSHLDNVEEQDLVISSGEGLIFPQGFALGRITHSQKHELYYKITISPLIDIAKLSYCMIISKDMIAHAPNAA